MLRTWLGYDDKARQITDIYVGVANKARKVIAGYVGVNGIARKIYPLHRVPIPSVTSSYVYNGNEIAVNISNYDEELVNLTGTRKATNAGTYTLTFSLNNTSYIWADGTTADKTYTWTINQASINIVFNESSGFTIEYLETKTITYNVYNQNNEIINSSIGNSATVINTLKNQIVVNAGGTSVKVTNTSQTPGTSQRGSFTIEFGATSNYTSASAYIWYRLPRPDIEY